MSLKELKRLAPWQWESKIATKKHKIGPKGLQEWEQVCFWIFSFYPLRVFILVALFCCLFVFSSENCATSPGN